MSGRGTASGISFQAQIGAAVAGLILAERDLSRLGSGLPGRPTQVLFETPTAVDDLFVRTNVGEVYVQAKNTISLSSRGDSELASVVDQFVRQFRAGVLESGGRRDFDPVRDRLLLAVSDQAAATVSNHLREALDRNRTGAATALPNKLSAALKIFADQIDAAWLSASGNPITSAEKQVFLRVCSVSAFGDAQRQIAVEALRQVVAAPGDETTVIDLLEKWALDGCSSGVGGDAGAIRFALAGKAKLDRTPCRRSCCRRDPPRRFVIGSVLRRALDCKGVWTARGGTSYEEHGEGGVSDRTLGKTSWHDHRAEGGAAWKYAGIDRHRP